MFGIHGKLPPHPQVIDYYVYTQHTHAQVLYNIIITTTMLRACEDRGTRVFGYLYTGKERGENKYRRTISPHKIILIIIIITMVNSYMAATATGFIDITIVIYPPSLPPYYVQHVVFMRPQGFGFLTADDDGRWE